MTKKELGKAMSEARKKEGLTVYAVAKKSGLAITQIKHIEKGDKAYTLDSLIKLASVYGMSISIAQKQS